MKYMNMFNWWTTLFLLNSISYMLISMKLLFTKKSFLMEWEIIKINSSEIYFSMIIDWMSMMFMSTVLLISSMILLYSNEYMSTNKFESKRFISLINLFILSMMMMIISPNLISIMIGWDGLGMISYCLVIFYSSKKSYNAGMITCLTNRIGDIALLISISWMMSYGSWHFLFYKEIYKEFIIYMILSACFTKSAQMPFYSWLPEAMAAPTPISALVHSSTLVTAGVYLSIRFINKMNMNNIMLLSILTTLMASICANYEFDLKKIIALSTLSQLGLMMTSTFMGMKEMSFMHLITHATFKSLLFMCAGIMIFYSNNNQDIRNLGLTCSNLPMTSLCFSISTMALCGMPFMSGFYSKDLILENMSISKMNMMSFLIMFLSLGLTVSYSTRTIYYLMKEKKLNLNIKLKKFNKMKMSMIVLTILSTCLGSTLMWMMNLDLKISIISKTLKINPMIMILLGMWMGMEMFSFKKYYLNTKIYSFNSNMWNILKMLPKVKMNMLFMSFMFKKNLNTEWGEFIGAKGMSNFLTKSSKMMMLTKKKTFMLSIILWMTTMM
uniref:NADH-ubiquinone oxidoreductase chain 5 n=1 Tax=Cicadellidae gen. 1 sp. 2 XYW-2023a TaxID=3078490 RepID=A0AB38ZHA1_9HEMI